MRKLQRFAAAEQRVDWWRVITDLDRPVVRVQEVAS